MKTAVVIGSYREDLAGLLDLAESLRAAGVDVLHPKAGARRTGEDEGFVRLSQDVSRDEAAVQRWVFDLIDRADATVVHNPSGRIGVSSALEIGYALRAFKRVMTTAEPTDATLRGLTLRLDMATVAANPEADPEDTLFDGPELTD